MSVIYTDEKNVLMLISLLKAHDIKKVVVSPGATNITFVASIQSDSYFEIISSVDERSAAYIACGIASETGEPVALSCTGATASRNYIPGMTEAYYRKLPVLAITSTQHVGRIGQNIAQVIDRSVPLNDIVKISIHIPTIHDEEDEWAYNVLINKALLELRHRGGGPAHINITTTYSRNFSTTILPATRVIKRICFGDCLPVLPQGKIAIFVGAHRTWSQELTFIVDTFCEKYNGIVICDHTSNYKGKYRALASLLFNQKNYVSACRNMDLLIHIGDTSGAYIPLKPINVWRVNPDGEIRDTFKNLQYTFEMEELIFFQQYCTQENANTYDISYWKDFSQENDNIRQQIKELPFSNAWIALNTSSLLPDNSVLYLGILNSLRCWNFFEIPKSILGYANTGGFGIDGYISSMIGASLAESEKLFFCIAGDLAFFYDMNVLGNRHIGNNVRILLINNGCGTEFKNYNHIAAELGNAANIYIAAEGHFGNKSKVLLKHYSEDLGFEYISASNKEEYFMYLDYFISKDNLTRPLIFEVFTNSSDESDALKILENLKG